MKKKILFLQLSIATALFAPGVLYGQQQTIKGIVKDMSGPVPGATVIEKGMPTNGAITNAKGLFSITLKGNSHTLIFRSVGYLEQERSTEEGSWLEVILQSKSMGLDEVQVIGYGTVKRITNTGAVSSIKGEKIRRIPTASVQNTLQGKLPGFFSQQRSGQPGKDASDFYIRGVSSLNPAGNRPLIIVDGIQYTYEQLSQINVNEIESISILKDASTTALYGIKGANGVLVVTTRRGELGKPKVNVRVETGLQTPVHVPQFLNAYQTAMLRNEALSNDGLPPQFSQQDLDLFKNHEDPYGHPDVNWYDVAFRSFTQQANTNIDISGGTKTVKYFISGGYLWQNGLLNDFTNKHSPYNSNYYYRRYNFRTNLDVQATQNLSLRLDLTGRFGVINQPAAQLYIGHDNNIINFLYNYNNITPFAAPILNPDGSYAYAYGTTNSGPTVNALLGTKGYERTRRTDFNILFGGTEKLDFILPGLAFKAQVAYASTGDAARTLWRPGDPPTFHYNPKDGSYTVNSDHRYRLDGFVLSPGNNLFNSTVNWQAFLTYDKTFGSHHVSALLLYNKDSRTYSAEVPVHTTGYSTRISYDFKKRYLLDFDMAYNGSDRFSAGHRFGWFPAVSAGWNISEEPFFKDRFPVFTLFKLRASYGLVGSDAILGNRYLYDQVYNRSAGYSFGTSAASSYNTTGIREGSLGNDNITWEKGKKADVGVDINMFKGKLSLTIDYFNDLRYDQLISRGAVSGILGVGVPPANLGKVRNKGYDGEVIWKDNIGRVQYTIDYVFSHAKNKILYMDEPAPRYPWLAATGHPIGQSFGYTWIGFYENDEDVARSAKPDLPGIQPGDLKYKDLNGDGIIDENDKSAIGFPNLPNTTMGLTLGIAYKGFYATTLFQTSFNYSFRIVGTGIEPFQSQLQPIHLKRWTPETADKAKFPRLTTLSSTINSSAAFPSSFWLINARYLRLKTLEIGYQLPSRWLPLKLTNVRLYLSAYNLFTWTNFDLYQQDAEVNSGSVGDNYPNMRVLNVGVGITF